MGPRRVGKTVLLLHTIQHLLERDADPNQILFLTVDHPFYNGMSIEAMLDLFGEATGVDPRREVCFVFLDEIQYLADWEIHLKALVDSYPNLRIIASGSAAAALQRQSRESGAGRFTDFRLPPLTFFEYLTLRGIVKSASWIGATPLGRTRRADEVELQPVLDEDPDGSKIDVVNRHFVDYLDFGGFPEAATSETVRSDPARFVRSDVLDKVLLRDLPGLYGIQDTQELYALFASLAYNTAEEISIDQLSQRSGVAKNTIRRHLEYLEAAFLIRIVHRVDRSAKRFQRARQFKVHLTNPSLRAALFAPLDSDSPDMGALVETGIYAQWFHGDATLHYARWGKGEEVDLVRLHPDLRVAEAVEIKWSDRVVGHPEDLRALLRFCRENSLGSAIVTTRTVRTKKTLGDTEIHFVPASSYAYFVGRRSILEDRRGP